MLAILSAIRTELTAVADERGLPIALPLLDLEDLDAVTFLDVWAGDEERIGSAATRYRADAVLIGRVRPGVLGVGNEIQWLLVNDGRSSCSAASRCATVSMPCPIRPPRTGVVGVAAAAELTVLDIGSLADYGRVMSYLDGLSVLQAVDVGFRRGVLRLRVSAATHACSACARARRRAESRTRASGRRAVVSS
jgi:hypothetical protein